MKLHLEKEFLDHVSGWGMALDERYPHAAVLNFRQAEAFSRFWEVPPEPERRPWFLSGLLDLLGEWSSCFVWRHMGSWPSKPDEEAGIDTRIEYQIFRGLGLPCGGEAVLEFARAEWDQFVTLIFTTTIFGWSVGQDLVIVPDTGHAILGISHHSVIHLSFRNEEAMRTFLRNMEVHGLPLPVDTE